MSKAVLVTTAHRGVFFGHVKDDAKLPAEITVTGARNCLYWEGVGGFLGLASKGPTRSCRIGASVAELQLFSITSVTPVEEAAIAAWEQAPVYGAA